MTIASRIRTVLGSVAALVLSVLLASAAVAQDAPKQIKLTAQQIEGFIAAQADLNALFGGNRGSGSGDPAADKKNLEELEKIAKKNGFTAYKDLDDVGANVIMVMSGLDPQSGEFTDPNTLLKREIEELKSDKSVPEKEKTQMLKELEDALKNTPPLQFPENVALVKQFREKIEAALK